MFRRTALGSLVAASLTAGTLMTMPSAGAAPSWKQGTVLTTINGALPSDVDVAGADNGFTVATWIQNGRVFARARINGAWASVDPVSDVGKEVSSPAVAVNEKGQAAITWTQKDNLDHLRLAGSRMLPDGSFNGFTLISAPLDLDVDGKASMGMDAAGRVLAAYQATDGGSDDEVRVTSWPSAAPTYTSTTLSDASNSAYAPSLSVNAAGTAIAAWLDAGVGNAEIKSRRLVGGTWESERTPGPTGLYLPDVETAISDSAFATIAYLEKVNGDDRVAANKVQPDGFVGDGELVSAPGHDAADLALDQNDAGTALAAWAQDGTDVTYAQRPQKSGWSTGVMAEPVAAPKAPSVSISDTGAIVIGYTGNGHQVTSYRHKAFLPLSNRVSEDGLDVVDGSARVEADDQGNLVAIGIVNDGGLNHGHLPVETFDAAGPTAWVSPLPSLQLTPKFTVGWNAVDRLSPVASGSVRVRAAAFNGGFGGYFSTLLNSAAKTRLVTGTPGRTYCFSSQAKDSLAIQGAWSAEQCTTLPVDDRSMTRVRGFKKSTAAGFYLGTFVKATKKGSLLTLPNVHAKRIAILVAKAPKGGKIRVTYAGKYLGTFSLKGSGSKKLVAVKTFGSVVTGKLVIKVVSKSGKVVRIDGVVASPR